ncbi:hypothetical protein [Escherichia coli]|uniref:hypothetical protein n=1 Tax=Escherichia coli TaxID=562 RepID=UPI003B27E58B
MTCAQWLWKKIIALYEQAAECDGEVVRPKEPKLDSLGKRNSPDVCAGWSYSQTNLRDVQPRQPRSVLVP